MSLKSLYDAAPLVIFSYPKARSHPLSSSRRSSCRAQERVSSSSHD